MCVCVCVRCEGLVILETYTSLDEDQLRLPHLSTVCLCVRCEGLVILETYTSLDEDQLRLPDFLEIVQEVTHVASYSMYNLTTKGVTTAAAAKAVKGAGAGPGAGAGAGAGVELEAGLEAMKDVACAAVPSTSDDSVTECTQTPNGIC